MNNTETDWRAALRDLAKHILEVEEKSSLEDLKIRCGQIFEALVILRHEEQKETESDLTEAEIPKEVVEEQLSKSHVRSSEPDREETETEEEYPTLSDLFVPTFDEIKEDMSQKEEFKDTVSLEETENLFTTPREEARQLSLNDKLVGSSIHFGLNDRIAFVNKLFNFSQSDFTKVVERLNAMNSFEEANYYIQYQVKKSYNWKGKEDLEERFMEIVERRFMT